MAFDILGGVIEFAIEVVGGLVGGAIDRKRGAPTPKSVATYAARPQRPPRARRNAASSTWTGPSGPLVIAASDATERSLVEQIAGDPTDAPARMIYGDWLESRGLLARASFVRGIDRLADVVAVVAETDAGWRAITNCQPIVCSSVACPRRWSALHPVAGDAWVRRCGTCERTTRYVTQLGELHARRAAGEQVLLDLATAIAK